MKVYRIYILKIYNSWLVYKFSVRSSLISDFSSLNRSNLSDIGDGKMIKIDHFISKKEQKVVFWNHGHRPPFPKKGQNRSILSKTPGEWSKTPNPSGKLVLRSHFFPLWGCFWPPGGSGPPFRGSDKEYDGQRVKMSIFYTFFHINPR